ncbi:hypothetical protein C0993_004523 [Termitomyces sp. T159_Od127]|nr:hypothetical protein C0993_004523 [Termitomyces sp. T159_Od127]
MPLHSWMELNEEEEHYERQFVDVPHKCYYQSVLSLWQALTTTYAHAVVAAIMREVVPQAQYEMGTKVLLQHPEAAGQPVPPTVSFLQDNLAVMVMEGLLNQIKLMRRQHILVLEQIDCAAKHKLSSSEKTVGKPKQETVGKPKQAWQQLPQLADIARAGVPTTMLLAGMPVQPTAALIGQPTSANMPMQPVAASSGQSAAVTPVLVALTVPKVPGVQKAMDEEMVVVEVGGTVPSPKRTMGQPKHRPSVPPLAASQLEIVDFPTNIPQWAEPAQMLFMKAIVFLAPPPQVAVVVVPTKQHTPVQYDGIVATAAAKKGKHHEAPSGHDDKNTCTVLPTNTVFISAKANQAATLEFSSGQQAKIPGMMVYKFAHHGFPSMPFELEWLHKYYTNPHVPHHDHVVAYMLLTKLQEFVWKCNMSLQDCTMKLLCDNPGYQEMVNPMQGPENLLLVEHHQILSCSLCIKEDGTSALRVVHMPDLNMLFNLKQLA